MSRGSSRPNAVASGSASKYQLHLFFAGVHRQPRYATGGSGRIIELWKRMNAFEIWEGDEEALVLAYDCE
jgi:hypothetical protein